MANTQHWQEIPTKLAIEKFEQFVLPHLSVGSRGPASKLTLHVVSKCILHLLHMGCQWKELPISKNKEGHPEIHYTRIYRTFRRWQATGCFDVIFAASVVKLQESDLLDTSIIHGDGTTSAAKKGGDNIGYNGIKRLKAIRLSPSVIVTAM
jgi:transposase